MKLGEQVNMAILKKVLTKYLMMRVKMKISYHAFLNNETVLELWLKSIKSTIKNLSSSE